jgi:hypothetical protein
VFHQQSNRRIVDWSIWMWREYHEQKRVVDALERLDEYKRAGELLYEPRYRDAEIKVAEAADFGTAQHCLMLIRTDRIMQRLVYRFIKR